ncbi:MAG: hypothetical protein ACRESZ_03535 [Methylococcales bacterium]
MPDTISISKDRYIFMGAAVIVLSIALLITLVKLSYCLNGGGKISSASLTENPIIIQNGKSVPMDGRGLRKYIQDNDIVLITLVDSNMRQKLVNDEGGELKICGESHDGIVPKTCFSEPIELQKVVPSTLIKHKGSDCFAYQSGNYWMTMHVDLPLRGKTPCHHPH